MFGLSLPHLAMSLLTVGVTVFLIHFVRKFGNIPTGFMGPDLNLLSFGFLWDTIVKSVLDGNYWPGFPEADTALLPKAVTLAIVVFFNIVLLLGNFKLAAQVPSWENVALRALGKSFITFLGILSGMFFVFAQTAWGSAL